MNNEVFTNISKIIERDSKSTTYKFALLRGVIDVILDNSPYISFSKERVHSFQLFQQYIKYDAKSKLVLT